MVRVTDVFASLRLGAMACLDPTPSLSGPLEHGKQLVYTAASVAQWSGQDALIQRGPRSACQGSAEKDRAVAQSASQMPHARGEERAWTRCGSPVDGSFCLLGVALRAVVNVFEFEVVCHPAWDRW